MSCRQLAEITKLSTRAIEALESGCLSALPEGIYRRSIVRAVASEVGLNPDQVLREISAAHPDDLPALDSAALMVSSVPSRSSHRVVAIVGALLPLLAGIAYFSWPSAPASDRTVSPEPAPTLVMRSAEILPAGGFAEAEPLLPRPVVVTLSISSRCQLRIVADGREVLGRTMEQGESLPLELGEEVWLLGDNASAVQFSINGQAGRPLGVPGEALSVRIGRDDYQDLLVRY